jgi:DNA topoisomerase-1
MRNVKREEILTDLTCPKCSQGQLAIRFGKNGEFLACNRYPECDFTSDFHRDGEGRIVIDAPAAPEVSDVICELCGRPMVLKKSRFGPFLGCSGYPECKNTRRLDKQGKPVPPPKATGVTLPEVSSGGIAGAARQVWATILRVQSLSEVRLPGELARGSCKLHARE